MKIKEWIECLESLGDEDALVGEIREYNGNTYYDLTITTDLGDGEFYDCTPEEDD
jgi:hypothetical protein